MPRQRTRLSDKDFKLLKKEGMEILGESGHLFPTFGNHVEDFVKFCIYDLNDTYIKSDISEDFENDGNTIKLKPGNDLRRVGFTRGDYKIKYFFYRRLAGADEIVLTKTVGDESGVVHSGNPQLTGIPMGLFYVDEDGKVFQGEIPPVDGSPPSELDVKEYKFFIDKISADKKEVRLAPQSINLNKYKDEFSSLSKLVNEYSPLVMSAGTDVYGKGKFGNPNSTGFTFDAKHPDDVGFLDKYLGGTLEVEEAFIVGHELQASTEENSNWELEGAIPEADLRANGGRLDTVVPAEWEGYTVIYSVSNKMGSALVPQNAVPSIYDPEDYVNSLGDLLAVWNANSVNGLMTGWYATNHGVTDKASFGQKHWDLYGKNEIGRHKKMYTHYMNMRYYWDFGCGHTELTDVPYAIHTYDVSPSEAGTFTPSVTIMTPNFTYSPDTLLDRQDRTHNKVTVGPFIEPPSPDSVAPTSPWDGRIVQNTQSALYYIQSGHKRYIGEMAEAWQLSVITGQYVGEHKLWNPETEVLDTIAEYIDYGMELSNDVSDAIPDGPPIELTGEYGITNPNTLNLLIIDGNLVRTTSTGDEDSGDDDSGDDDSGGDDSGGDTSEQYSIITQTGTGEGTTTGDGTFDEGATVVITANPATNYEFVDWTAPAGVVTNVNAAATTIVVSQGATVTANFAGLPMYTLTVVAGTHGQVKIDQGSAGSSRTITAGQGTSHYITVVPDDYYRINTWGEDAGPTGFNWPTPYPTSQTVTMGGEDISISVTFTVLT
jgi:hypothetical protein